jgi:hypothetical protein
MSCCSNTSRVIVRVADEQTHEPIANASVSRINSDYSYAFMGYTNNQGELQINLNCPFTVYIEREGYELAIENIFTLRNNTFNNVLYLTKYDALAYKQESIADYVIYYDGPDMYRIHSKVDNIIMNCNYNEYLNYINTHDVANKKFVYIFGKLNDRNIMNSIIAKHESVLRDNKVDSISFQEGISDRVPPHGRPIIKYYKYEKHEDVR